MKRTTKIISISILLIGIFIGGWFLQTYVQDQKTQEANEELYKQYHSTATHMHMEVNEDTYEKTEDPKDLVLIPTRMTFALLDRWEVIAKNYPEMDYPKESIDQGNWLHVSEILGSQAFMMDEISVKIGEEYAANPDKGLNQKAVYDYIYYDDRSETYFQRFLEDHGVE